MITIGNKKVDIEKILRENSFSNIQREIIRILDMSKTNYKYDTEKELLFELMLRNEIVKVSKQLADSRFRFEVFNKSKCNTKYWRRRSDGGFELKSWVTPSEAINDIFVNSHLYATECSTALTIIYYKALLNVFGKTAFNRLFPNIVLKNWQYLSKYIAEIKDMKKVRDAIPGDRRYVKNPDVSPNYPECQGENLIDMGNGIYYGHGIGLTNMRAIIDELNKYRKRGSRKSAFLTDLSANPDYKKLADIYYSGNNFSNFQ